MNTSKINTIFQRFANQTPFPQTELYFTNPYTLLVAVVLSAQATDKGVNKATTPLFKKVSTPEAMVQLGEEGLKNYIKTIGLYNSKAKYIIALSQALIDHHHSQVPEDREALEALPGVGRKTANVVLNCAFSHPTLAVDTHIFRVSNRIGLVHTKNVLQTELHLLKIIPSCWLLHAHHWLILHGRYTCKARKPLCHHCLIKDLCEFPDKTSLEQT